MNIDELNLPEYIKLHLKKLGYNELYPPQIEAIKKGLFTNRNMVIATPTASGKTLIAILAIIHNLINYGGKAIYLVPLKALAKEKYHEIKEILDIEIHGRKPRITISTGDYDTPGHQLANADIIIATNERMDSILRHNPTWINDIKILIADEGHLIGVEDRGPVLESILTRIKLELKNTRILLLSATINNREDFREWLNSVLVSRDWRPVPLREGVLYNHTITYNDGKEIYFRKITGDPILDNAYQTILEGGQVLIFTQTRREAVGKAKKYSMFMENRRDLFTKEELDSLSRASIDILERGEFTELSRILAELIKTGVAFHHAGINPIHREIIEREFRKGNIKILTATPTLAAGVNLPSRKVIITYISRRGIGGFEERLTTFEYKQMAGRAGRPTYDQYGEALLYTKYENIINILMEDYINAEPEPIKSRLLEGENLEMQILGIISTYKIANSEIISNFIGNTLCYIQHGEKRITRRLNNSINTLINGKLVTYNENKDIFKPTKLGIRVSQLYISPSTGIYLNESIREIMNNDGSIRDIHLLYLISNTSDMGSLPVNKKDIDNIIKRLDELVVDEEEIFNIIEAYGSPYLQDDISTWKITLVLYDWINEVSEDEILKRWRVEPGDLYVLRSNAEWLAYSAGEIAKLNNSQKLYKKYQVLTIRIKYGIKEELLPLVTLADIGRRRARILYRHGYRSIKDLKKANYGDLVSIPGIGDRIAKKIIGQIKNL